MEFWTMLSENMSWVLVFYEAVSAAWVVCYDMNGMTTENAE
jgi:hypothetical protein